MVAESTLDRHRRILAVATGLGTIIFTLLASGAIVEQASSMQPWTYNPLAALFCGLPILLIPVGIWATQSSIIWIARVHTAVVVIIVLTWVPTMMVDRLPDDWAPWVLNTLAVGAATAVIAWPAAFAWSFVIVLSAMGGVLRYVVSDNGDVSIPFQDFLSMLSFSLVIATILIVTLKAGRAQDEYLERALADARAAAEVESRARQRARFGSLVHDEVITTLLAAARSRGRAPAVQESAGRALRRVDEFVEDSAAAEAFAPETLDLQLRSCGSEFATGIRFTGDLREFGGLIPAPVALALTGALAEGVRNSSRHGGAGPVHREVTFAATLSTVSVTLTDDGPGFDPHRVPPERLGIRASIVGRMVAVGGSATISSAPRKGASVELTWSSE